MSKTSKKVENNGSEALVVKQKIKLTAKALANKIESLQKERKAYVDKIKCLIPAMKELMKRKENVQEVRTQLKILTQYLDTAVNLHQTLILLLPEDEKVKQNESFLSAENYYGTFKNAVIDGMKMKMFLILLKMTWLQQKRMCEWMLSHKRQHCRQVQSHFMNYRMM